MDPFLSEGAFVDSVNGIIKTRRDNLLRAYLLRALGPDGYNAETQELTCADGTTVPFAAENYNWKMFLLTLFALPSRPESVVIKYSGGEEAEQTNKRCNSLDEKDYLYTPQYSILQIVRNLIGGWNPIKETTNGDKQLEVEVERTEDVVDNEGKVILNEDGQPKTITVREKQKTKEKASYYLRRWTEKKVFLLALAVIRVPLFVAFNLLTWPFRFLRNILKLVTEVLLPIVSLYGLIFCVGFLLERLNDAGNRIRASGLNRHLLWQIPVYGLYGVFTLVVGILQYALTLTCRAGLAFTSPLKSALLAFNSGVLILGSESSTSLFSRLVGALGFVLSMALSATLWAIAFPLALGALVAAVPALLTPITALSQSPFIATVLAWLTQLPFVPILSTAFGTAFGVVGGALTATFGAAIGYIGAFVGVAIPQVVMAFSLIMSVLIMPAFTLLTWPVEALSNRIMRWVEQRPFRALFVKSEESQEARAEREAKRANVPDTVYVHQALPGGGCIVSSKACHMVAVLFEGVEAVQKKFEVLEVKDPVQRKAIWNKAHAGEGYFAQRVKPANNKEEAATEAAPEFVNSYS
jgi:hypothetical protein